MTYDVIDFLCSIYSPLMIVWKYVKKPFQREKSIIFYIYKALNMSKSLSTPCEHYKWFPGLELKNLLGFEEQ